MKLLISDSLFIVNFITENTLNTPADDATQVYIPESSTFAFQIWIFPSTPTFDLPRGNSPFSFIHVTVGAGSPVAWQETVIFPFLLTSTCLGGLTVNWGIFTTTSWVRADTCPKGLEAWHSYRPESSFWTFIKDSSRPFKKILDLDSSPPTLSHVITAGGKLVTRHSGKVTLLFIWT